MNRTYQYNNLTEKEIGQICQTLASGGVGVLPTDTIYGLHGSVKFPKTIERIYQLKKRERNKPMIILISSISDLDYFDISLDRKSRAILKKIWPNPVSVILPCSNPKFKYLHRGKKSLAFRMPKNKFLQNILLQTGPLVSTSVNLAGDKSANSIQEAHEYFAVPAMPLAASLRLASGQAGTGGQGDKIDFYVDKGELINGSSTVIALENGEIQLLRQGSFKLS